MDLDFGFGFWTGLGLDNNYGFDPRFLREHGYNYSPMSSACLDRAQFPSLGLVVEVLSGQHIPRPGGVEDTEWEVVDPYVEVRDTCRASVSVKRNKYCDRGHIKAGDNYCNL